MLGNKPTMRCTDYETKRSHIVKPAFIASTTTIYHFLDKFVIFRFIKSAHFPNILYTMVYTDDIFSVYVIEVVKIPDCG